MPIFNHLDSLHAIAGFLVGLLVGLTGVGGGSLMTPLLVLLFGVAPATAVGTDLLYASITKMAGSGVHGLRNTVEWPIVRRLALGSVPAAVATLALMARAGHPGKGTEHVILVALAVLLALTALTVVARSRILRFTRSHEPVVAGQSTTIATVILGAVIGVAVTLSSVGAGAIGVTALIVLYPRLPVVRIVGSDIAHAVPLTLVAGAGHWVIGDVDGTLLVNLLLGSIPGVIVGSLLSTRAPEQTLRLLLAAVLAISSWQLAVKATTPARAPAAIAKPAHAGA